MTALDDYNKTRKAPISHARFADLKPEKKAMFVASYRARKDDWMKAVCRVDRQNSEDRIWLRSRYPFLKRGTIVRLGTPTADPQ